ncbi:MAG: hypothetical protein FWF63_04265 [Fibromonadales bacterium]|nr:hypothetical protein [Fibromonadales bacterium]
MKKFLPFCLFAIGFGFAQSPWLSEPISPPPESAPEVKPTISASVFDVVRGHGYNPFSIAGAASSVNDLVFVPSDIYGKKFFYVSPTDKLGYASFDLLGGSTLLGLRNQLNEDGEPLLASLVLGYATSGFGVAFEYSIGKEWTETKTEVGDDNYTDSRRITFPGDNIGLYFSLPLGSVTAYANVRWLTYQNSYIVEYKGRPDDEDNYWTKVDYSTIDADFGLRGAIGALNYDTYLKIQRFGGTMTSSEENFSSMGEKVVTDSSYLAVALNMNLGYAALKNETARVIVGSNNAFSIKFLDEIDPGKPITGETQLTAGGSIMALVISPNILGEVVLADNWLAFAGARHDIIFLFGSETPREEDTKETTVIQMNLDRYEQTEKMTGIGEMGTDAFVGIRYQKPNWALEAQVSANPFKALAGDNIFASFGGFIYF